MQPANIAANQSFRLLIRCGWFCLVMICFCRASAQESANSPIHLLSDLQAFVAAKTGAIASFSVTGRVCAVQSNSRLVVLQDDSATVLLELPELDSHVRPGSWLAVHGNQVAVTRNLVGLQIGAAPVAEIDGIHPPQTGFGSVFLDVGYQPIRVEWFNGVESATLRLEYEGPGTPRQQIPDSVLWRRTAGGSSPGSFQTGLDFAAYTGAGWDALPDFRKLDPLATGSIQNFEIDGRPRPENVAMVFGGFLQISNAGIYTFYVRSDDGGRIFVGNPASRCFSTILERPPQLPQPKSMSQALAGRSNGEWAFLEGKVSFACPNGRHLELEIMDRDQPVSVTVVNGALAGVPNLSQQRVRVTGICQLPHEGRTSRIIVPDVEHLRIIGPPAAMNADEVLTTAAQVRRLQPDEARKPLRARVRGVVTMATYWSCVVQDLTGGIFVRRCTDEWREQPVVGELWEFDGITDPGDFSPIICASNATCLGAAVLPEPVHPTWEQLVNGSMDAEFVEIQGVVVDVSAQELTLLTRDGKVKILEKSSYMLPRNSTREADALKLPGSVVRVRGVFAAAWGADSRRLNPGRFFLGNAMLSVDEPTPGNPFDVPARHVTDLLLFTSHVGALTRVKVAGQVLYARPREYFLLDGANGFRVVTRESMPLAEGDRVEAVGFPQLGGPSPVLLEAKVRKIGNSSRPDPVPISAADLSNERNDATLVQMEALLLSDVVRQGERVMECEAGPHRFQARLRMDDNSPPLLRPGSRLRLAGVYSSTRDREAGNDIDAFELLLSRASDIVVLKQGPWWTIRHTIVVIGVLLAGLTASLVWVGLLRRTVAQRTARLEKEISQRQHIEHRRVLERERARVAQDLHDDLGAGLAQIGLIGALAQRPNTMPDRTQEHLLEITEKSREMTTVLDEIVWAINPKHDSTKSVSSYLCDYAQEFLRPTTIACRLEVASSQPPLALNSTQRHQLFLAFKEALTNVVKHAHAAEVWIRIAAQDGNLCVIVEDDGKGMLPDKSGLNGDGTANMRSRLEEIGGQCEIRSRPGGGTIVSFRIAAVIANMRPDDTRVFK